MAAKKKATAWNTVTPFSKTLALALFIFLPILAFFLGMTYRGEIDRDFYLSNVNYSVQQVVTPTNTPLK